MLMEIVKITLFVEKSIFLAAHTPLNFFDSFCSFFRLFSQFFFSWNIRNSDQRVSNMSNTLFQGTKTTAIALIIFMRCGYHFHFRATSNWFSEIYGHTACLLHRSSHSKRITIIFIHTAHIQHYRLWWIEFFFHQNIEIITSRFCLYYYLDHA